MVVMSELSAKSQKKVKFRGIFRDKFIENLTDFVGISRKFSKKKKKKTIGKKWPILWKFSGQILLEIDRFWAHLMSVFNVFLTEIIICYFNNKAIEK